jgi:hypothetical protein
LKHAFNLIIHGITAALQRINSIRGFVDECLRTLQSEFAWWCSHPNTCLHDENKPVFAASGRLMRGGGAYSFLHRTLACDR